LKHGGWGWWVLHNSHGFDAEKEQVITGGIDKKGVASISVKVAIIRVHLLLMRLKVSEHVVSEELSVPPNPTP